MCEEEFSWSCAVGNEDSFFKESHVSAHCNDFPWHTKITFLSCCPAQCLLQALHLAYLILITMSLWRRHCLAVQQVNSCQLFFVLPFWRFPASEQDYFTDHHLYLMQFVRGIICSAPVIWYLVTKNKTLQLEWVMGPVLFFPPVWAGLWKDICHECLAFKCLYEDWLLSSSSVRRLCQRH